MTNMTAQMMSARQHDLPEPGIDLEMLQECVQACAACEEACLICADSMTGESMAKSRSLWLTTADMSRAMTRAMLRPKGMQTDALAAMMHAVVALCVASVEACAKHTDMSDEARICAEACREASASCRAMLDYMHGTMQWA